MFDGVERPPGFFCPWFAIRETSSVDWTTRQDVPDAALNLSQYKGCLVDLDGTLYRAGPLKLAMSVELLLLGLGSLRTIRCFRRMHEQLRQEPEGSIGSPFEVQLRRTSEVLALPEEVVRATIESWMIERPAKWVRFFRRADLLEALCRFQGGGGRLALVSDYPATVKLKALESIIRFEAVVANGEPGGAASLKPNPEGYLAAAKALSLEPNDCLVIGDRADADGEAAARAGMAFHLVG